MEDLKQKIQEAIEKDLPKQVGESLQKRLAEADQLEAQNKTLIDTKTSNEATIRGLESRIAEYQKFDERNAALELREKAVADKERNLKIETLEYQLAAEKEKTAHAKEVNNGLTRNIEYRKDMFSSTNQPGRWQYDSALGRDIWTKEDGSSSSNKDESTTAH